MDPGSRETGPCHHFIGSLDAGKSPCNDWLPCGPLSWQLSIASAYSVDSPTHQSGNTKTKENARTAFCCDYGISEPLQWQFHRCVTRRGAPRLCLRQNLVSGLMSFPNSVMLFHVWHCLEERARSHSYVPAKYLLPCRCVISPPKLCSAGPPSLT